MTTLAHTSTLTRESRQPLEPRTMNVSHSRSTAPFAAYELTGEAAVDAGVRSEEAYHRFLDRSVTIRRLLPAGIGRAQRYYGFVQSIHTQATLRHPSIAQVFDAGIHDELPYAVLERPRGATLEDHMGWLAEQGARIDTAEALRAVDALADLLQYAHAHGARVHGLVPSNIVLTDDGIPVLAQVGAPETPDALRSSEERAAFSAPELLTGALSDHRSDIYALGALLYFTLTGRTLSLGDDQGEPATGLGSLPHDADTELLERVIRRATARRLADRYSSVAAFRHDLAQVLTGRAIAPEWEEIAEEPLMEREVGAAVPTPAPVRRPQAAPPVMPPLPAAPATRELVDSQSGLPVQNPIDVPGADRAEFHGALPYTILVPTAADPAGSAGAPAAGGASLAASFGTAKLSLLSFLLVVAIALGTALMLG